MRRGENFACFVHFAHFAMERRTGLQACCSGPTEALVPCSIRDGHTSTLLQVLTNSAARLKTLQSQIPSEFIFCLLSENAFFEPWSRILLDLAYDQLLLSLSRQAADSCPAVVALPNMTIASRSATLHFSARPAVSRRNGVCASCSFLCSFLRQESSDVLAEHCRIATEGSPPH